MISATITVVVSEIIIEILTNYLKCCILVLGVKFSLVKNLTTFQKRRIKKCRRNGKTT